MPPEVLVGQEPPVKIGDVAPDFTLIGIDGKPHSLASHRGRRVMLSFLRYASCALCQLDVDRLKQKNLQFQKGQVDVICIFQSPPEVLRQYVLKQDPPFACLGDPAMEVYRKYNVRSSERGCKIAIWKFKRLPFGTGPKAAKLGFRGEAQPGGAKDKWQAPADFLIDENGIVVDYFHARTADEHMPWRRIKSFMPVDPDKKKSMYRRGLRSKKGSTNSSSIRSGESCGIYMG